MQVRNVETFATCGGQGMGLEVRGVRRMPFWLKGREMTRWTHTTARRTRARRAQNTPPPGHPLCPSVPPAPVSRLNGSHPPRRLLGCTSPAHVSTNAPLPALNHHRCRSSTPPPAGKAPSFPRPQRGGAEGDSGETILEALCVSPLACSAGPLNAELTKTKQNKTQNMNIGRRAP